jgi:transcription antitermination factor NusG
VPEKMKSNMLNADLLLDSARPFSDTLTCDKQSQECREQTIAGVLESCHNRWYALRVSYSRELKVQERLVSEGVRTFVPMMWKKKEVDGKVVKVLVPAVNNLCFAFSTRERLKDFIASYGEKSPVHFIWNRATRNPIVVPERQMNDFMQVASTLDEDLIYLTEISAKLREGQTVRVKNGPLAGITGKIVRIRKSRRILVELPGTLAIASTYVKMEDVEVVEKE